MKEKKHKFVFGVFREGKLLFQFNTIECSHTVASLLVSVLDLAKGVLREGDYFAADYYENIF